jgi:hypothetical protein
LKLLVLDGFGFEPDRGQPISFLLRTPPSSTLITPDTLRCIRRRAHYRHVLVASSRIASSVCTVTCTVDRFDRRAHHTRRSPIVITTQLRVTSTLASCPPCPITSSPPPSWSRTTQTSPLAPSPHMPHRPIVLTSSTGRPTSTPHRARTTHPQHHPTLHTSSLTICLTSVSTVVSPSPYRLCEHHLLVKSSDGLVVIDDLRRTGKLLLKSRALAKWTAKSDLQGRFAGEGIMDLGRIILRLGSPTEQVTLVHVATNSIQGPRMFGRVVRASAFHPESHGFGSQMEHVAPKKNSSHSAFLYAEDAHYVHVRPAPFIRGLAVSLRPSKLLCTLAYLYAEGISFVAPVT